MRRATSSVLIALLISGCAGTAATGSVPAPVAPAPVVPAPAPPSVATPQTPPPGQQWLYGSAEGTVAARQTWREIGNYVVTMASSKQRVGKIFAAGATPAEPRFAPCGKLPLAAVFDADETLLLNLGAMRWFAEHNVSFDEKIWDDWERTGAGKAIAVPGAIDALAAMRTAGVAIIINTNRSAKNASGTVATLKAAGLGDFVHGTDLFLMGDTLGGSDKDGRRTIIASRYCVIAMAGDQLGDFSNMFNAKGLSIAARKALTGNMAIDQLWGAGWFVLPNPVYGPSIRGSFDEIFPDGARWTPGEKGAE